MSSSLELLTLVKAMQGSGGSYTTGNGIDITSNKISTKIDGSTIKFDDGGKMYAVGGVATNVLQAIYGETLYATVYQAIQDGKIVYMINDGCTYTIASCTTTAITFVAVKTDKVIYYTTLTPMYVGANDNGWSDIIEKQLTYTAGTGIDITNNVISATGGGSYTAGNGIDITNNAITTKIDDDTIKFNDAGEMYGAKDLTYHDFTSKNIVIETDVEQVSTAIMTKGNRTADTVAWISGTAKFNLGEHTEPFKGVLIAILTDRTTGEETYENLDVVEETPGNYEYMEWTVSNDIFYMRLINSQGTATEQSFSVANKYVHYECELYNITSVTLASISGKLYDYVYSFPHDERLDNAFDNPGYIKLGSEEIEIRDLTLLDLHQADSSILYGYYDGEYTYFYDFYRKDYCMMYSGNDDNYDNVRVQIELYNPIFNKETLYLGTYNLWDKQKEEIESYTLEEGEIVVYLIFTATYSEETNAYTAKWTLRDKSYNVVHTTTTKEIYSPSCLYAQLPGKFSTKDISNIDTSGTYKTYVANKESEIEMFDWGRDVQVTQDLSTKSYTGQIEYDIGWSGQANKNYNLTNGFVSFVPNNDPSSTESVPVGHWVFTINDAQGNILTTLDYDETADGHERLGYVEFVRDAFGCHIITTTRDSSHTTSAEEQMERDVYSYVKFTWTSMDETWEPTSMPTLCNETEGLAAYEKIYSTNIASTNIYGLVKYDGDTLNVNGDGQLYVVNRNNYIAGDGIDIYDNTIYTKIDGNTITFDEKGQMTANISAEYEDRITTLEKEIEMLKSAIEELNNK